MRCPIIRLRAGIGLPIAWMPLPRLPMARRGTSVRDNRDIANRNADIGTLPLRRAINLGRLSCVPLTPLPDHEYTPVTVSAIHTVGTQPDHEEAGIDKVLFPVCDGAASFLDGCYAEESGIASRKVGGRPESSGTGDLRDRFFRVQYLLSRHV